MKTASLLTALSVLCPALALGATHSAISTSVFALSAPGSNYSSPSAELFFHWVDGTTQAAGSAWLKTSTNDVFVFNLISVTAPTTVDAITGKWNIRKNGALVCSACDGQAYGLSNGGIPSGGYFKFYGGPAGNTYAYHIGGYVTNRSDY